MNRIEESLTDANRVCANWTVRKISAMRSPLWWNVFKIKSAQLNNILTV